MILATLALAALQRAAAGAAARVDAVAVSTASDAVRVTGELSAEVWQTVPPTGGFMQREPNDGAEPSQRTEFRVAYDASTLFVKVRAFDTDPDKIVTYLTRRDSDSPGDWLRVMIDSYHDKRTAYEFGVNPSGVKMDRYWFNDNNRDDSWDAVWDVSVSRDAQGWSAEFRIPFSQLRFNPSQTNTFGLAVVARHRPVEGNLDLAAAVAQRQRLRLVVRRARRPRDERLGEAPGARAVHGHEPGAAVDRRQPADQDDPIPARRSGWT